MVLALCQSTGCYMRLAASGVEFAAEIAEAHPSISVTLISRSPKLLRGLPQAAGAAVTEWLQGHGVHLVLGDSVEATATEGERTKVCELRSGGQV